MTNGIIWYSPEDLVRIGFLRSPIVMMNEAHDGWKRCIRTREIGARLLQRAQKYQTELELRGGCAGFLSEDAPANFSAAMYADALLLALENEMTE